MQDTSVVGDEAIDSLALAVIHEVLGSGERIVSVAGFDFETKVFAVTDFRVLCADNEGFLELNAFYPEAKNAGLPPGVSLLGGAVGRRGRTLLLECDGVPLEYRMGKDETVATLVSIISYRRQQHGSAGGNRLSFGEVAGFVGPGSGGQLVEEPESESSVGIAERVRFWEEQDRINEVLIPRVVRQNELLSEHLSDHEQLPVVAAEAARQAVLSAQEVMERHLAEVVSERESQALLLQEARGEREEQARLLQEARG